METYVDPYTQVPVYSLYRKDSKRLNGRCWMRSIWLSTIFRMSGSGIIPSFTRCCTPWRIARRQARSSSCWTGSIPRRRDGGRESIEAGLSLLRRELSALRPLRPDGRRGGGDGERADEVETASCMWCAAKAGIGRCSSLTPGSRGSCRPWGCRGSIRPCCIQALACFEGTNISEGRGTTAPFEIIGAPFIEAEKLAQEMNG